MIDCFDTGIPLNPRQERNEQSDNSVEHVAWLFFRAKDEFPSQLVVNDEIIKVKSGEDKEDKKGLHAKVFNI